jgi:hypothetical protein
MRKVPRVVSPGLLTRETWEPIARAIDANFRECIIQPGTGYNVRNSPGGQSLEIKRGLGGGASVTFDPFRIFTQTDPGDATQLQWGINYNSRLYLSYKPDDDYSISGLLTSATPTSTDAGWFNVDSTTPDAIWLELKYNTSTNDIDTASIKSWGNSDNFTLSADAWDVSDSQTPYIEGDGGTPLKFKYARKLIGFTTIVDSNPVITQLMTRHQVVEAYAVLGRACFYPFDYQGGY